MRSDGFEVDERKAVRHVLRALLLDGEEWGKQRSPVPSAGAGSFRALRQRQLDAYLLHGGGGQFKAGEGIRIRPPRREAHMAAIWCKWRSHGARLDCWFFLGIWLGNGQFIAFRFEPPEQGDNHNYYHSQPCRSMGWEGTPEYKTMRVPERNPTWPLPATSSLDLLLCLVVSIRGMIGLEELKLRIDREGIGRQNKLLATAFGRMTALQKTATP